MPQRILIAADTLFMRLTLKNILANNGYVDVVLVDNGRDAVDQYLAVVPDLALFDAGLRGLDAISATREIMNAYPDARIALCTAACRRNTVVEAIQAGIKEMIVSPLSAGQVLESVRRLIGPPRYSSGGLAKAA
jgi:two-component system, chemotaxis family, chemotaxis protein CheY